MYILCICESVFESKSLWYSAKQFIRVSRIYLVLCMNEWANAVVNFFDVVDNIKRRKWSSSLNTNSRIGLGFLPSNYSVSFL